MITSFYYEPAGKGLHDITQLVGREVSHFGVEEGLATIYIRHTSASLVIQENADPAVLHDLQEWMDRAVPESNRYKHRQEGPDDMPAHIKGAITATHVSVPIKSGILALGVWQGIFLWEHRVRPPQRELILHVSD